MSAIMKDIVSPEWWFSVVIVGIVVGVAGTYFSSATSFTVSYALKHLKIRKEKSQEATKIAIEKLNSDPDFREFIFQGEIRAYIASIALLGLAAVTFGMFVFLAYTPELISLRYLMKYLAFFCAVSLLYAGSKFLNGSYLGRGLILAAKERFPDL